MCWSAEVSLCTVGWSWFVCIIAYFRNATYRDRWVSLCLFVFSSYACSLELLIYMYSMQLLEAILWWDFSRCPASGFNCCSELNWYLTVVAIPFILAIEPLASLYGGSSKLQNFLHWKKLKIVFWVHGIVIFVGCIWPGSIFQACTTVTPLGHLLWWGRQVFGLP